MRALSVEKIRALERRIREDFLVSERLLIENASRGACEVMESLDLPRQIVIFAGNGNNGADALALGRHLYNRNIQVIFALVRIGKTMNKEIKFQLSLLERLIPGRSFWHLNAPEDIFSFLEKRKISFAVDGIFGIGFHPPLALFYQHLFADINQKSSRILALDIPSGVCADTGFVDTTAIRATYTVSFLAPKKCFSQRSCRKFLGKVFLKDIGLNLRFSGKMSANV